MSNIFSEIIKCTPHTLQDVRKALDTAYANKTDVFDLMKQHHDYLKESISVVLDKDAPSFDKQFHLIRFFKLLEMHGKAEEETLYAQLRKNREQEARLEGFGGQDEHEIAFQLEEELAEMGYLTGWSEEIAAKGRVAVALVQNHIKEEENKMFQIALKDLSDSQLERMRIDYIDKCKATLQEVDGRRSTSEIRTDANDDFSRYDL